LYSQEIEAPEVCEDVSPEAGDGVGVQEAVGEIGRIIKPNLY